MNFIVVLVFVLSTTSSVVAFSSEQKTGLPTFSASTRTWSPDPGAEKPYGIVTTLLSNGPMPAFTRLTQPDNYMQAVYKFQAAEECTLRYAQGNMDAYFENPNDWAYQRRVETGQMESETSDYRRPYGEPMPRGQLVLTAVWGIGISGLLVRLIPDVAAGKYCIGNSSLTFCRVFFPDL